jgi:hypothetical protein
MEHFGRRARVRSDAASELGGRYAGHHGRIDEIARDSASLEVIRYTVRLDDGATQLELHPSEVEILD